MNKVLMFGAVLAMVLAGCQQGSEENGGGAAEGKDGKKVHRAATTKEQIKGKWRLAERPDFMVVITENRYKEVAGEEVVLDEAYTLYNDCDPALNTAPSKYGNHMRMEIGGQMRCNVIVKHFGNDSMHFFLHSGKLGMFARDREKADGEPDSAE